MGTASDPLDLSQEIVLFLLPVDIPSAYQNRLLQNHPGLTIRSWKMRTDTKLLTPEDVPKELFQDVTILCVQAINLPSASLIRNVHLVQLISAGPDKAANHALYKDPSVAFCTTNGIHGPQIAEWVIASWLSHQHQFMKYAAYQQQCYWPSNFERATAAIEDSPGLRMGILGYGAIGRQCARHAQVMGMDVIAYTLSRRSTPESRKDDSYCLPGTGDPEGLIPSAWYHGSSTKSINDFLSQGLDVLVMALPLTSSTKHIIAAEQFEVMSKKRTFVINVGRGPHIDTDALVAALESGKIRGAAVDVTEPEPLPETHPLWKAPNIFITPHVSWRTPHYFTRVMDILEQNLGRLSKRAKLMNQVDKVLNY